MLEQKKNNDKLLLLVDGSSYLYRAYHALPPLSTSRGEPTGAIYGVINMLLRLLADQQPTFVAVVFDAKGKTFRDDIYKEYKAQRPPMPDDLQAQIEPLHNIVRAMGLPLLMVPGVEADDVIGTLAIQAAKEGIRCVISTGDKDMAQLVSDGITLVNTMSNTYLDVKGVIEKFGVPPQQIIDYLALVGDASDNIPGIPKVGPKTAVKWLNTYGSLKNVIERAAEVQGKVGDNLRSHIDQLPLSRQLATIKLDVELDVTPRTLSPRPRDTDTLRECYKRLEFRTWLAQLSGNETGTTSDTSMAKPSRYETIMSHDALKRWVAKLKEAELFSFDLETTSLDYVSAEIVGMSFAITPETAAYVPLAHDYLGAPQQLSLDAVLEEIKPLLEDSGQHKVGQNIKYDMNVLTNYGIQLSGIQFDTMLESYTLNSTATRHDMDSLALKYLDYETIHYEDVAGKGAKQIPFNEVPVEKAAPYAAEDADITLRLHRTLWPRLAAEPTLKDVFNHIEMPLIPVLSKMECNGVLVDADLLKAQSVELAERMIELEEEAHNAAGQTFNLGSPKQIQEIFYNQLGLPVLQKTPKGQPSTAESVLQELALDYPLPKLILEHRALSKLKSTYTDKIPQQINRKTGRVHTSYHQAVAATGRLSSSDPNLQNIPIRSSEGRRIRQAFITPSGYKILAADYSQIELRIMAHLSADEGLLEAFSKGDDVHRATAAEIFGQEPENVNAEQRRSAKAINFGLIYGMSAFGLSRQLGIDRSAAQEYVDLYFRRYPGVKAFMDRMREEAFEAGYVETVFGRRLYLPEIRSRNAQRRQYAERAAINAPMQGTAADIIKRAMIAVQQWIDHERADVTMIMQVHDELIFEIPARSNTDVVTAITRCMTEAASLAVPLVVDVGLGNNWDQAH